MTKNLSNLYYNFVNFSRNNNIYQEFTEKDTFSDRLLILLIHFAFFIKSKKKSDDSKLLQNVHDHFFKSLEYDIREAGYGDVTVNKKMKDYLNMFYFILDKIHNWDFINSEEKKSILSEFLNTNKSMLKLTNYFNKFNEFTINKPLNYFTKGVISFKF